MKLNLEKYIVIIFTLLLLVSAIYAQDKEPDPKITGKIIESDSTYFGNTIITDSLKQVKYDSLFYAADTIKYSYQKEQIKLVGNSTITYHAAHLKSDTISINLKNKQAFTRGQSILEDGSYLILGDGISYDMDSEFGIVKNGATKFEQGFCYGDELRKIESETFDLDNAIFTTCDALNPHFYIRAKKLRLYKDDKIIAKPLIVYVNHLPIFALPYGTFTIKRGRESGFLVPSPGYNSVDGKMLRDIAYYQVWGKYADSKLSLDYYENTGWELNLRNRYIKRYMLKGNINASLLKKIEPFRTKYEWDISAKHHQDFSDDAIFDANLHFISSTSVWENSESIDEREQEKITSSISYKKPLWGRTLSITGTYTENLIEKTKSLTLPSISYSLASKPIYELFYDQNSKIPEYAWWKNFSYSYKLKATHEADINDPNSNLSDLFYETTQDSNGTYINQHIAGVKHELGLTYSKKYRGWLDFSQSFRYNEAWYDRDKNYDINKDIFVRGSDYSLTSSLGFSLYGLGDLPGDYIRAIRHVISPNISFSFKPNFTRNEDFYSLSGISLYSGKKQKKISFSLGNNWDLKLSKKSNSEDISDNESTEKLNNFFKINSSLNYDYEKEDKGFSNISHSLNMNLKKFDFGFFSVSTSPRGTITQDFYNLKSHGANPLDWNYAVDYWSASLTSKLTISGKANYIDYFPMPQNRFDSNKFFAPDTTDADSEDLALTLENFDEMQSQNKAWSLTFNHTYQTNKNNYKNNDYTSNLRSSLSARITKNWEISYNNYINLKTKEIASHNFTLTRDLHCWKLVFTYSYSALNNYWNYRFKLFNIKLPNDLKFKTSGHK